VAVATPMTFSCSTSPGQAGRPLTTVVTPLSDIDRLVEQMTSDVVDFQVDRSSATWQRQCPGRAGNQGRGERPGKGRQRIADHPLRQLSHFRGDQAERSDIHIEPKEKALKIRYRVDGLLFETMSPPADMQAAIVSRLKIMANLDISERRLRRTAAFGR